MVAVKIVAAVLIMTSLSALAKAAADPTATDPGEWIRGFAKQSDKDNPIPKELVTKLEADYRATKDPVLDANKPTVRKLLTVRSELTQNETRALKGQVRILTPPGGGTVDLEEFVTPLRGAFQLRLAVENDRHEAQPISRVFFISHNKERKIDGDTFGSGCGKYFDITSYFQKSMTTKGFELYTADQRYLSVLRGSFVVASFTPGALQLASVTFFDSRYSKWDCPFAEGA